MAPALSRISNGSDGSEYYPAYRLLRPNRHGITFQIPTNPALPVHATLEVRIPVDTVPTDDADPGLLVAYIVRKHNVQMNRADGTIEPLRHDKIAGYKFVLHGPVPGVAPPSLHPESFGANESLFHKPDCRTQTVLHHSSRGRCFCNIDHEFAPREVLDAYRDALRQPGRSVRLRQGSR
ncbi:hypothetical protein BJ508DRAFT_418346 [Ascobolus immersus RN42]|uniref:Uncharacterized protein n=1 Tax=Ascobolus immersus RN42 TaxID=1160509 RepID=A0A3N4HMJ9_ASCIM|nr:hypothetical protein BJ508DRAFT_418346 [Ascobolus immersus RN42]